MANSFIRSLMNFFHVSLMTFLIIVLPNPTFPLSEVI